MWANFFPYMHFSSGEVHFRKEVRPMRGITVMCRDLMVEVSTPALVTLEVAIAIVVLGLI